MEVPRPDGPDDNRGKESRILDDIMEGRLTFIRDEYLCCMLGLDRLCILRALVPIWRQSLDLVAASVRLEAAASMGCGGLLLRSRICL